MGLGFIAAKVDHHIAVAQDCLVTVLEKRLQLRLVLQDDIGGDVAAPHGGEDLREAFWKRHVGKFIHPECNGNRQGAVMFKVCDIIQFLEDLGIQYAYKEVVGLVTVRNDAEERCLSVGILIPVPMLLACIANSKIMKYTKVFKTIYFIPALTSVVVAGTIFRLILGESDSALMNQVIAFFGHESIKWLKRPVTGYIALLVLACWRWIGVNMMYYIAGLQNIPPELYEAASIDGASDWQKLTRISIPLLKPTTTYVLTISINAGLAMFVESYMLYKGNNSPGNIGLTIVGYLYRQGIEKNQMGYASAVGLILMLLVLIINMAQLSLSGYFRKEER